MGVRVLAGAELSAQLLSEVQCSPSLCHWKKRWALTRLQDNGLGEVAPRNGTQNRPSSADQRVNVLTSRNPEEGNLGGQNRALTWDLELVSLT